MRHLIGFVAAAGAALLAHAEAPVLENDAMRILFAAALSVDVEALVERVV